MLEETEWLFQRMPEKSVVAVTTMVTGYCMAGKVESARSLFDGIRGKDLVAWNAMMSDLDRKDHLSLLRVCLIFSDKVVFERSARIEKTSARFFKIAYVLEVSPEITLTSMLEELAIFRCKKKSVITFHECMMPETRLYLTRNGGRQLI